jgi:hypothetical protein
MALNSLFEGRFQQYFDAILGFRSLWLFVHVPKTAGSSLNAELVPILSPNHHIFVDYSRLDQRPFDEMLNEAVERFIYLASQRRYAYCTGHINARHVEQIVAGLPDVRPITLLRDPVARFISDYRYQCSPMHPGNEAFKAAHPVIASYLELPGEWNKAAAHLVPAGLVDTGDAAACADHIMATFDFVGIQESYPLSLRLITTLAGAPRRPAVFKRVNTPTPETEVRLTPELEDRIRLRNALDVAIYEDLAGRFHAIEADLVDYLDRADPLPPE